MAAGQVLLVLGGVRAGKSAFALARAHEAAHVVFLATAEAGDDEMRERITRHQAERPATWITVEAPLEIANAATEAVLPEGTLVVDCLTLWTSNLLCRPDVPTDVTGDALRELDALLQRMRARAANVILVSNEVGMGIVPDTPLGRRYRDLLGTVNARAAALADEVTLLVAGLPWRLKP
jgi:adenosylcobinamide kinase / adenosylcobinamide-phosphate guanylyltransferase